MTQPRKGSSVPARALGAQLVRARETRGLTRAAAALELGVSEQTVRRAERDGYAKLTTVSALCALYEVSPQVRQLLMDLARQANVPGWWHAYGDAVPSWFELYVGLEGSASRLRSFDPLLVNGLLQAPGYMDTAIRAVQPTLTDEEVSGRVKVRRERQQILTRSFPDPVRVDVVIGEAVLLADLREGIMREQIQHLLRAADLPSVSVRVLPLEVGPHRGSVAGAFTLLDFPSEKEHTPPSTVYGESHTGAIYLDQPHEIEAYQKVWEGLEEASLNPADSIKKMSEIMKELKDREG